MDQFEGTVLKVASDAQHGFSKPVRDRINLIEGHGVKGDAHAGPYVTHKFLARWGMRRPNLRQLHLIGAELFEDLRSFGYIVGAGDLGRDSQRCSAATLSYAAASVTGRAAQPQRHAKGHARRISLTGRPFVHASRTAKSTATFSRTCQIKPARADTVSN